MLQWIETRLAALILSLSSSWCCASMPIMTLTLQAGATTALTQNNMGSANYLVTLNPRFPGPLSPLTVQGGLPLGVTQLTTGVSPCTNAPTICEASFSLSPGGSCCLMLGLTGSDMPLGANTIRPIVGTVPGTYRSQSSPLEVMVTKGPILSASVSTLALSVSDLILNTVQSGTARTITITNIGDTTATNLQVSQPALPSGTGQTTTCINLLAAGQTCTITITPGTTGTSNCTTTVGAATPATITVSADNIALVHTDVVVLGYGCIYQGGYVFSMTETSNTAQSIGGTVAATSDQSDGIIWSSNGTGSLPNNVSNDLIPGINEASTPSNPSPTYNEFLLFFNMTYNSLPILPPLAFSKCTGNLDGNCNTNNILAFYNHYITYQNTTNSAVIGVTPLVDYAAGLCKAAPIDDYSDWYLPAICELGYAQSPFPPATGCGSSSQPTLQNMQSNLVEHLTLPLLSGNYWSSTETSSLSATTVWYQVLGIQVLGINVAEQVTAAKYTIPKVRCVRALTF